MIDKKTYFDTFFNDFRQEILRGSEEDETTHEDKFTELMLDALEEADETENAVVCYHKKTGIKVNGFGINDLGDVIDIFVSDYSGSKIPITIPKSEIEMIFRRAENFFEKCLDSYYSNLEEAQPVYDLADRIFRFRDDFRKIRFFLLTDKKSKLEEIKDKIKENFIYTYHVWDINRYYKLISSGKSRESITIKLKEDFNSSLPCLNEGCDNPIYTSYLTVMPGRTLFVLYDEYGPRLLERNVRSFLQVRGNVNKGIKDTVLNDPEMFFAYNNGLSSTAECVTTEIVEGRTYITNIRDFQIVNGAQTTATIHDTYIKNTDKIDLELIQVPMKITILKESSELDEFVPKISQFSNTQNKIDMADFSSNHPFHIKMEELSARIRAPSREGIQLESYWFYERVRGQYLNKRNREDTPSKKKLFDKIYPKSQKIEKTELPIFEHTWHMRPFDVSLGKQKNYKIFMDELSLSSENMPDDKYYTDVIAKAILYKETYSIVRKTLEGGYRPNIVTYAISYLNYKTDYKINLERIWKEQGICDELSDVLSYLVKEIQKFIINAPEGKNVTEFCKKKECWDKLCMENIELPEKVQAAFLTTKEIDKFDSNREKITELGLKSKILFNNVSSEDWEKLSYWGLETGCLNPKHRNIAKKIYSNIKAGKQCSPSIIQEAISVLNIAKEGGFQFNSLDTSEKDTSENYDNYNEIHLKPKTETATVPSNQSSCISDKKIEDDVVHILTNHGGILKISSLLQELGEVWCEILTEEDLEKGRSGSPRWHVRVTKFKNELIKKGILENNRNLGIWKLAERIKSSPDKVANENLANTYMEFEELNDNINSISSIDIFNNIPDVQKAIIRILAENGGSDKIKHVNYKIIKLGKVSDPEYPSIPKNISEIYSEIISAKKELIKAGLMEKKAISGKWKLTEKALKIYNEASDSI